MARIPNQLLLKGTVGNLIYYTVGGKQYVWTKPSQVRQPNTPKQLLARDKFRQSSKLAKALSQAAPVLGLDETGNTTKSTYHTLLGCLRKSPFAENTDPVRWVWEELLIRKGEMPEVALKAKYDPELQQLTLNWDTSHVKDSRLLVVEINTENLEVKVHRIFTEEGETVQPAAPGTAWYACVIQNDVGKVKVSASQFLKIISG